MRKPAPGTIGLSKIDGMLGAAISFRQALHGDASGWTHAFVVVDDHRVIQAMPKGAEYADLDFYLQPDRAVFLHDWYTLTPTQVNNLQVEADRMIGARYGFLDYVSLIFYGWGVKLPLTRKRIQKTGQMICSQLCDELLRRVGVKLFHDDRLPMDVTPGDLHIQWTKHMSAKRINDILPYDGIPPYYPTVPVSPIDPTHAS